MRGSVQALLAGAALMAAGLGVAAPAAATAAAPPLLAQNFTSPGPGVTAIASDGSSFCAVTTSAGVDCWGLGEYGQLGDGDFYPAGHQGSAVPVGVKGVGGTGILTGVAALVAGGNGGGYCALLTSGGVDCWGYDYDGQLGDGQFRTSGNQGSAVPVRVEGVGGADVLSGVTGLSSDGGGYCALLASGGVDCWGDGYLGQLGNGHFYSSYTQGSAVPVRVEGAGGAGTLSGVASLATDNTGYCAVLASGGVDCWGYGYYGDLGNGVSYRQGRQGSAVPVHVDGTGGTGVLTGVAALTAGGNSDNYCALLASGGVDCWGDGQDGQLGDGRFYTSGNHDSAVPVQVHGAGGTGTLADAESLISDGDGYCALTTSDGADCWGDGEYGQLGNGRFYHPGGIPGSAVPVPVDGAGGTGSLTDASGLIAGGIGDGYCAVLASTGMDCWGYGYDGELGDGMFYTSGQEGSAVPVQVVGAGGTGSLAGVASADSDGSAYCTVMASDGADCWGDGYDGQLGDGHFYTSGNYGSAVPVKVH